MFDIERRMIPGEVRALSADGASYVEGTGIVFSQWSDDLGGFRELVDPAATDGALDPDMAVCFNHDANFLLGRAPNTAEISTDASGVHYRAEINPDDPSAVSTHAKIARGDVTGSSFQFRVEDDRWESDDTGTRRTILKFAEVIEMGPVVFPAYSQTVASARATDIAKRMVEVRSRGEMTDDDLGFFAGANVKITTREGKVLSASNVDSLNQALEHHKAMGDIITGVIDSACNPNRSGGAPDEDAEDVAGRHDVARRKLDLKTRQ